MRGLKTQENDKFKKFWDKVQVAANKCGCVFFADCGEGHLLITDELECEDMRGWLIPKSRADEFEIEWLKNQVSEKWIDNIFWAEWNEIDENISIDFNTY